MTFTAAEISDIFQEYHDEVDRATRDATIGPNNPWGQAYISNVWWGTIEEAWGSWSYQRRLIDTINRLRHDAVADGEDYDEIGEDATWDDNVEEIEAAALECDSVIGQGRPILIAYCDADFPTVFCDQSDESAVRHAVSSFYPDND